TLCRIKGLWRFCPSQQVYCANDPINHVDPDGLFFGKLFGWIGKIFKWIGIAAAIAVAVISIAFPGAWIANLAIWAGKHPILSAILGINTPKFAIVNLAYIGPRAGAIAFGTGAFLSSAIGAVTSLLAQKESQSRGTDNVKKDPCDIRDITIPPGVSVDTNIKIAQDAVKSIFLGADMAARPGSYIAAAMWFRNQVRNAKGRINDVRSGRSWDYKQLGPQYRDIGNFNFGATGAATGLFDDTTLFKKAGEAQIAAGTSRPEWKGPPLYGDPPEDHDMIQRGIDYYKAGCHKRNK
ncbi:MAG: polymorphic toxin type 44 domain-containing protein, partial [Nitrososphaerales archaeon]